MILVLLWESGSVSVIWFIISFISVVKYFLWIGVLSVLEVSFEQEKFMIFPECEKRKLCELSRLS